jgi:hypothetical protein
MVRPMSPARLRSRCCNKRNSIFSTDNCDCLSVECPVKLRKLTDALRRKVCEDVTSAVDHEVMEAGSIHSANQIASSHPHSAQSFYVQSADKILFASHDMI